MADIRPKRKVRLGRVVSDKMDKTVVVLVESFRKHDLYGRRMRTSKRYLAHDEENRCRVGDKVLIMETRPLSARKRWRVAEILETSAQPVPEHDLGEE
ncbi:MAG: 30S ribosomal protein S17 [Clostridia bacterium]|nr:30S ribosomal protein S17 [Clostridia bacterium]